MNKNGETGKSNRPNQSNPNYYLSRMLGGSLGGLIEALVFSASDVAKTRMQLDKGKKYNGLVHCIKTIYKEEGFKSLYKGISPFVTHLTLKYALRLGTFDVTQNRINSLVDGRYFPSIHPITKLWTTGMIAGGVAGATEAMLIVTPFELIKTRLQQQHGQIKSNWKYRGPIHCAQTVYKEEGIKAIWNGAMPTVIRQSTNQACNFAAVGLMNKYLWEKDKTIGLFPLYKSFISGFIAGSIGPILNHPMDVVKSRLQIKQNQYQSTMHALLTIAKEEGIKSLYKGLFPRLLRIGPGQALSWASITRVQDLFENRG